MIGSVAASLLALTAPLQDQSQPENLGFLTAGALLEKCSETTAAGASYCFAYIAAVRDTMRAYEVWLNQKEFCPPVTASQADLRRTFVTYVNAYPENRMGQAASVIVVALKESYPCAGAKPPK